MTRQGGREAFASSDGRFLYYAGSFGVQGIWRMPVSGGESVRILENGEQSLWALLDDGICLLDRRAKNGPAMVFYDFATEKARRIRTLPRDAGDSVLGVGYMDVSPDGKWLLYTQPDLQESDIMLVENFQ